MIGPKEELYDSKIAPLVTQIIELCKEAKINMAMQFALDPSEEEGSIYCTTVLGDADPDDKEGMEHMEALYKVMKPRPKFSAYMITVSKPKET